MVASLFVFTTLSLSLLITCHADLISDICSASQFPSFCTKTLRSDPAAQAATDLRSLGKVVISKAIAASQIAIKIAKSIDSPIASMCAEVTNFAINDLDTASSNLEGGKQYDIVYYAGMAYYYLATCDDKFGNSEPANLKAATAEVKKLIIIFLVIGDKL